MSDAVRIGSIIIFHLSKLGKAKFFLLCDVIFLVRLQGKFDIDHSCGWKASSTRISEFFIGISEHQSASIWTKINKDHSYSSKHYNASPRFGRESLWYSAIKWQESFDLIRGFQQLGPGWSGPGCSKPDSPNPGLSRNLPQCQFVRGYETDSLPKRLHCELKNQTSDPAVFLRLNTCSLLDHKWRWRILLIRD